MLFSATPIRLLEISDFPRAVPSLEYAQREELWSVGRRLEIEPFTKVGFNFLVGQQTPQNPAV